MSIRNPNCSEDWRCLGEWHKAISCLGTDIIKGRITGMPCPNRENIKKNIHLHFDAWEKVRVLEWQMEQKEKGKEPKSFALDFDPVTNKCTKRPIHYSDDLYKKAMTASREAEKISEICRDENEHFAKYYYTKEEQLTDKGRWSPEPIVIELGNVQYENE